VHTIKERSGVKQFLPKAEIELTEKSPATGGQAGLFVPRRCQRGAANWIILQVTGNVQKD
ncbi:hypothetical protein, partial [Mesorhizobium sp. M8A.F.Ca.ET.021.01.1.1]|uniref:hypothetical protein n=1 Tax=Mesorhizobium sp. M8A.F.Ca.ET.021.01.1.1 TaxID=2496757 RepID=UPI001AECA0DD